MGNTLCWAVLEGLPWWRCPADRREARAPMAQKGQQLRRAHSQSTPGKEATSEPQHKEVAKVSGV